MDKIKKVFSPGKDKDDEIMYGAPSKEPASTLESTQAVPSSTLETKPEAEQKDKGVLRQIFNPGGDKYLEQSYGTTATTQSGMADQLQKQPASQEPLKGSETAQLNDDKVAQVPRDSTTSGSTSLGPSTMAREDKQDDVSNATFTARSYALGSSGHSDPQQTSTNVDQATRATTDLGPTGDELSREHTGRRLDHSLAGAGIGGAGAGYVAQDELQEFMKHGRDPEADQATYLAREHYVGSSSEADPFQRPGHDLYNAEKGPAGLESAGEAAPGHMPGEFPTDDGGDAHGKSSGIGTGSAAASGLGVGAVGAAASKAYNDRTTDPSNPSEGSTYTTGQPSSPIQTTTNTMRSGSSSMPSQITSADPTTEEKERSSGFKGALAAATAAMGLGGAGAYAASRDDKKEPSPKAAEPTTTSHTTRSTGPSNVAPGSVVSEQTQSYAQHRPGYETGTTDPTPSTTQKSDREDQTARNVALGTGAAGAAGAGAYALSRDRDENEPRSVVSDATQSYAGTHPTDRSSANKAVQPSTSTRDPAVQQPTESDHTARNAALGGGALAGAGAGAYALNKDADSSPSSSSAANPQSVVSEATQKYHRSHPGDNDSALRSSPTTSSTQPTAPTQASSASRAQQPEDHTSRNAALGAAGLTGAGAGAYALSNRDGTDAGNVQSVVTPETQRYHGSHPSDTNQAYQGSGSSISPSSQTQTTGRAQPPVEDHTARNAALGAGGVAAAGAGAYGLTNRDASNADNVRSVVTPETQRYHGSHPSDNNSSYQSSTTTTTAPTSQAQSSGYSQQPREEDHTARNAALGAGAAGAAGAGAYGLSNRDTTNTDNVRSVVTPETQRYHGSHPSDNNPSYQSSTTTAPTSQAQSSVYSQQPREEDHTARNAALSAGAVGAAGAGAYYMSRDDDKARNAQSAVSPTTQQYAGSHPEPSKTTTTSSSKTKDTVSSSKPTTTSEYSRSTAQPYEEDRTARNAALGAGGAAAVGAGAHGLSQDGQPRSTTTTTSQPPSSSQLGGTGTTYGQPSQRLDDSAMESSILGAGTTGYGSQPTTQPQSEDHTERNAALGVGGVGAAGAGAYALSRNNDETGPASKTIGPHESNIANVVDPRARPEPTQQFEKTTAGPHQSNIANKMDPRVTSDPSKAQEEQGRNYGRDAGVAGGTGAAGYGAYQYANRNEPTQQPTTQYEHDPRVATGSDGHHKLHKKAVDTEPQTDDHTARNTALGAGGVAGAGAAGYGAKEYYDHKRDSQDTTESQEHEKKHGLLHKILHPREHKREKEEEELRRSSDNRGSYEQPTGVAATSSAGPMASSNTPDPSYTGQAGDGSVTEPHTGLPMNVGKYGTTGTGGTDGAQQIEGYHGDRTAEGGIIGSGTQRM